MKFHCLFEQSGTFKNMFKKYGHTAYDYDLLNNYKQTDFKVDLFKEIENEYDNIIWYGGKNDISIFSKMKLNEDFIIAFFPCTHFADANSLQYRLWNAGKRLNFDIMATNRLIERNKERAKYFELYLKFCQIVKFKQIPTIIENPASGGTSNYLQLFSPIDIAFYEKDRTLYGDTFKKPTNFFALNFTMKENFIFFDKNYCKKNIYKDAYGMTNRSIITSCYAENFYKRFIENYVTS